MGLGINNINYSNNFYQSSSSMNQANLYQQAIPSINNSGNVALNSLSELISSKNKNLSDTEENFFRLLKSMDETFEQLENIHNNSGQNVFTDEDYQSYFEASQNLEAMFKDLQASVSELAAGKKEINDLNKMLSYYYNQIELLKKQIEDNRLDIKEEVKSEKMRPSIYQQK